MRAPPLAFSFQRWGLLWRAGGAPSGSQLRVQEPDGPAVQMGLSCTLDPLCPGTEPSGVLLPALNPSTVPLPAA